MVPGRGPELLQSLVPSQDRCLGAQRHRDTQPLHHTFTRLTSELSFTVKGFPPNKRKRIRGAALPVAKIILNLF